MRFFFFFFSGHCHLYIFLFFFFFLVGGGWGGAGGGGGGNSPEVTLHLDTINSDKENQIVVFLLAVPKRFLCCSFFFVRLCLHITKTHLYNSDPLKPHFYRVNLRLTAVYIIFLISAQNIDCGYSLEYPQSMF